MPEKKWEEWIFVRLMGWNGTIRAQTARGCSATMNGPISHKYSSLRSSGTSAQD